MAIGGGILLLTSLFFFYMEDSNLASFLLYAASLSLATFLVIRIALWKVKSSKDAKGREEEEQAGFQALIYPKELVGKTGFAATDLKPLGQVRIEDENFEAYSHSGSIEKGTPVQVLNGKGIRLIVKALE